MIQFNPISFSEKHGLSVQFLVAKAKIGHGFHPQMPYLVPQTDTNPKAALPTQSVQKLLSSSSKKIIPHSGKTSTEEQMFIEICQWWETSNILSKRIQK